MEMILGPEMLALLLLAAFLAGFVDAVAGGGGLIMMPTLLTIGLAPHTALGTNKLAGTFGTMMSAGVYARKKIFQPRMWLLMIFATFIGAVSGTLLAMALSADMVKKIIPVFIILVAGYVLWPRRLAACAEPIRRGRRSEIAMGGTLGFYDGLIGPGTGSFWVSLSMLVYRIDIIQASALARSMNFVSNIVSCITFMLLSSVNYTIGLTMGAALMLGAYVGVHSAIRYGVTYVKYFFVSVAVLLAARLIQQEWLL
ncbi:MAG: TSUP family transporter [Gammaproteobacteria bacterium]|nr:TSUP family transporter [Gammaproteobacteria bacterium]